MLLKSLLSEMGPMIMTIDMTQYYRWHHPRPAASDLLAADKVQLKVVGETVDVSDWVRLGTGPGKIACCSMLLKAQVSFYVSDRDGLDRGVDVWFHCLSVRGSDRERGDRE